VIGPIYPPRSREWDSAKRRFPNGDDANRLIEATYHNGWSLEKA
jgi:hypothetical protein